MRKTLRKSIIFVLTPLIAAGATILLSSYDYLTEEIIVRLPCPGDCASYIECHNGIPIPMRCPEGLHFNARLSVCDWPQSAGCDEKKIAETVCKCPAVNPTKPSNNNGEREVLLTIPIYKGAPRNAQ